MASNKLYDFDVADIVKLKWAKGYPNHILILEKAQQPHIYIWLCLETGYISPGSRLDKTNARRIA